MPLNMRPNPPYPRLIKVLAFAGLLLILAFPLGMLFVGFATVDVNCLRAESGRLPNCEIRETRPFGLFERQAKVWDVKGVGYRTRDVDTSSRVTLASTVVLEGSNGTIPVSEAASNTGHDWKSDLIRRVQLFLDSPDEHAYSTRIHERNVFGWTGVAFIAFFAWSYIAWFIRRRSGGAKSRNGSTASAKLR